MELGFIDGTCAATVFLGSVSAYSMIRQLFK